MLALKKLFAPIDMTEGAPWKKLVAFTVPMLIGNVFQQLYSTVDAIIVGRYVGDHALAAISSTGAVFFLLLVFFIGISSGAGIMVSQYFGAKKREELSRTIGACITLLTLCGVVVMVFAPMITRPLLVLLDTPPEILDWACSYMNILLWGIHGVVYFNILTGILRGMGDSVSPLLYLIISSAVNVALDILFIPILGMGVAGAAVATIIAQFISGILCIRRLLQMRDVFDFGAKYLAPKKEYITQVMKLGMPTGASQAVFSLAMVLVQSLTNSFGPMVIAAYGIVMRIDGFVMMPVFSFSNAIMVFTGQNVGAGKLDRVKQGTKQCAIMAVGTAVVIVIGIVVFGGHMAGLFTATGEIITMTLRFLRILSLGYIGMALSQVVWGVIRGAGDVMTPMWASFITTVGIRVPAAYMLVHFTGKPDSIVLSLLITWLIGTVYGIVAYRIGKWRSKGIVKQNETI